jgi:hypothetical protein
MGQSHTGLRPIVPLAEATFDVARTVSPPCFLDDERLSLREIHRVPGSALGSYTLPRRGQLGNRRLSSPRVRAGLVRGSARHEAVAYV